MKFFAKLQGIDLDKHKEESTPLFKDPKEYENLSEEEKKELTEKMIQSHKLKLG